MLDANPGFSSANLYGGFVVWSELGARRFIPTLVLADGAEDKRVRPHAQVPWRDGRRLSCVTIIHMPATAFP